MSAGINSNYKSNTLWHHIQIQQIHASMSDKEGIDLRVANKKLTIIYAKPIGTIENPAVRTRIVEVPTQSTFWATLMKILSLFVPYFNKQYVPLSLEIEGNIYYVSRSDLAKEFSRCSFSYQEFPSSFNNDDFGDNIDAENNAYRLKEHLLQHFGKSTSTLL